jgi:hypothetical protein
MSQVYPVTATEHSINCFNQATEAIKVEPIGSFYIYKDFVAHATSFEDIVVEFDTKWNRVYQERLVNKYESEKFRDFVGKISTNDLASSDVGADIISAIMLGIVNKVDGDDFEKGFMGLFKCALTHKITRNFITGGYLFQAKDEVAEKFALPSDVPIEDNVTSFIECMLNVIHMKREG